MNIQEGAIIQYVIHLKYGASTWHVANAFKMPTANVRKILIKAEKSGLVRRSESSQRNNIIWTSPFEDNQC